MAEHSIKSHWAGLILRNLPKHPENTKSFTVFSAATHFKPSVVSSLFVNYNLNMILFLNYLYIIVKDVWIVGWKATFLFTVKIPSNFYD